MIAPVTLRIDVDAPALSRLPDRADVSFLEGEVEAAADWVRMVWVSAVSGNVLPGMTGPVNDPEYARSLGMPSALRKVGKLEYAITARYDKAARIENGFAAFDMKPGLLGGPKARPTKDGTGMWNIVPFRFGTPQGGKQKGQSRPNFPGEMTMPPEVYNIVKRGDRLPASPWGQRTKIPFLFTQDTMSGVNKEAVIRGILGPMVAPYQWQTGLYSGMQRVGAGRQSQYMTFRAVATARNVVVRYRLPDGRIGQRVVARGSKLDSWMHPGMGANPLMKAVRDYVMPRVEAMLLNAVDAIR